MLDGNVQNDIKYFEEALIKQVTADTEAYLREKIQPQLDELIKDIAAQSVGKWATRINAMEHNHGFSPITEIQVNFVEEVINKVHQENVINVKVNK